MTDPIKRAMPYSVRVFSTLLLFLFANVAYAQNTISTVAGSPPPNNIVPTAASLEGPVDVVRDSAGNLFVLTDSGVIYKVTSGTTAPGTLTIYAGNNHAGFATSGVQATSALTNEPDSGAFDANGNFYFSDGGNCVVREIVTAIPGIINTVAGNGTCGFSGDGLAATSAQLNFPQGIAFDPSGNLFIADINNNVIRRVDATTKDITTYAGTGARGFAGDGGPANQATFEFPEAVATDANGNLFIVDSGNNKIRRVDVGTNVITTVVGTGAANYTGDGGLATAATMQDPAAVVVDPSGNLYIADAGNAVIRKVIASTNIITTIVGNHGFGFGGDGGPALSATLTNLLGLTVDPVTGNVWIADFQNNRIRLYTPSNGQISTVVGNGLVGDGGPATSASLYDPRSPALDSQGNLYIVDTQNSRIRKVDTSGNITTIVGNGIPCPQPQETCGDGGAPTSASIDVPRTVTVEASGTLLVADSGDQRIREVLNGVITTIAGTGAQCGSQNAPLPCGDGGPAVDASLNDPRGVVVDSHRNIFFVDAQDNRVRRIDATTQDISTVAGNGPDGNAGLCVPNSAENTSGDGGPAVNAILNCPLGLDIDANNNLFVSDTQNNRIRRIDATTQIITTVAGSGTSAGFSGDNGPATNALLNNPNRISVNGAGNFFISDTDNNRIRRVDGTSGIITTFAGNGSFAFAGDGGPALSASFATPTGVVVDDQGDMYVGDLANNRIRLVLLNPNVGLSATTLPFATQPINANSTLPVTVTNTGDAPLTISNILISAGAFTLAANPCPATLAVGAQCILEIGFAPTQFISYTGAVTISDNGPTAGSTQAVSLSGTGAASLTVTATGTGTITSAPAGITCPGTCTATFAGNTPVVLTAAAGANFTFAGFSTNCVPTGVTCTVTMSADETVTATFTPSGGGGGGIAINPTTLPNGAIGGTYSQELIASGGTAPYSFSISAGALPAGLKLGSTNSSRFVAIGGVPAGPAGPTSFTLQVTDSSATPVVATFNFTITINAADNSNDAELNGAYAFLLTGFNDSDGTMVMTAGSIIANGQGTISFGFEDVDGSAGAQPVQEFLGTYTLGADNRGTMSLTTNFGTPQASTAVYAFSVGDLQSGIATKARIIRFDDLSGTTGQTGSGVMYKQDPSVFQLSGIKGSYAFGESGSRISNGAPQWAVGILNADGLGDFMPAGVVDINNAGALVSSTAISGTYQLSAETVSNGRLTASSTATDVNGTISDVVYIVNSSQFLFVSINTTQNVIYSGLAQLQVPPAGGFGASSLNQNSVIAVQGKQTTGTPIALIGSLTATAPNFTLSFVQNNGSDTTATGTAGGTYTVDTNGRAVLTFTSGGLAQTILYLDGVNQGFAGVTDTTASEGFIEPGGSNFSNATLSGSGSFFLGTYNPPTIQDVDESGVVVTFGATMENSVVDASLPGGILLADVAGSQTYSVLPDGQLTFVGQGVVGYAASACKVEYLVENGPKAQLGTAECQGVQTSGPLLTVTEAGTGTGTVTSNPTGINCPTACSANFTTGTPITLTAAPAAGSTFTGWGAPCEGTGTCVVTLTAATTVVATFTQSTNNVALTVTEAGTGTGTVTSTPAGIACQPTCSASFASGQVVALTPTAAAGSTFAGWSGAGPCEGTEVCTFAITVATSVVANFTKSVTNFALTVAEAGTGTGTVTSTPAGIACQPTCSAGFASGQVVALAATAAEGSNFAGWSGAGCTGTNACSVTMSAAETVTATFNSGTSPVTITVAPGSPTTVNTTPGGTAVFGLLLTALPGTAGTVTLGCTSPSPNITCQIVPGSITLSGKGTNVAVVLNTFCTAALPGYGPFPGGTIGGIGLLLASLALCGAIWKMKSQPRWALSLGVLILMAAGMSACGSLPKSPGGQATPPGNYPLVVTATAPNGSVSSVNLTLTVLP